LIYNNQLNYKLATIIFENKDNNSESGFIQTKTELSMYEGTIKRVFIQYSRGFGGQKQKGII